MNTVVTLTDPSGELIATLSNTMDMMHGNDEMGMMGMSSNSTTNWKTKKYTVSGPLGTIATADVRYPATAQMWLRIRSSATFFV